MNSGENSGRRSKRQTRMRIILAEHYGDAGAWLHGDQWDTVMNYDAFMEPLTWFFTGMEKHSDDYQQGMLGNADSFRGAMVYHMASFLGPSLQVAMNELSNHDHSRFLTRTNHHVGRVEHLGSNAASENVRPEVMREAVVMQMTWPGAPTVYYGDEAGVCGFTDPDNRRTYPWGHEDQADAGVPQGCDPDAPDQSGVKDRFAAVFAYGLQLSWLCTFYEKRADHSPV